MRARTFRCLACSLYTYLLSGTEELLLKLVLGWLTAGLLGGPSCCWWTTTDCKHRTDCRRSSDWCSGCSGSSPQLGPFLPLFCLPAKKKKEEMSELPANGQRGAAKRLDVCFYNGAVAPHKIGKSGSADLMFTCSWARRRYRQDN